MFRDTVRPVSYWFYSCSFLIFHLMLALYLVPSFFSFSEELQNYSIKALAPFFIVLCLSLIPRKVRECVSHFRLKDPLPGCRAFSIYAKDDHRISIETLRRAVGSFPRKGKEQNARWYRLYMSKKTMPEVIAAQRKYLLFRDLAVIQAGLILAWFSIAILFGTTQIWIVFGINLILYGAFVIATNNSGGSFVQTVLAVSQT
jgi:hypothetical protein